MFISLHNSNLQDHTSFLVKPQALLNVAARPYVAFVSSPYVGPYDLECLSSSSPHIDSLNLIASITTEKERKIVEQGTTWKEIWEVHLLKKSSFLVVKWAKVNLEELMHHPQAETRHCSWDNTTSLTLNSLQAENEDDFKLVTKCKTKHHMVTKSRSRES